MSLVRSHGLKICSKNLKDCNATEKYYGRLCLNSIVVLEDEKYMKMLDISNEAATELSKHFLVPTVEIPEFKDNLKNVFDKSISMECKQKYKFLAIKSFSFSGDDSKKLSIMANIYKLISQEKSILDHWQSSSEWTIIIKIWANVFETLFEDTMIELIWGDTKNDPFKIDLRLCVVVDKKKHDVSNTEFKKNGNRSERKKDTAKLLTEGKQILNGFIKLHNLDLEESKKKKSMVVQVCGLKALITEVRLVAPGCYMPNQFGKTLKYPYDLKSAKLFLEQSLQQLFAYKVCLTVPLADI
ncbi:uncharacterized protein B0P05DRAFT_561973 [Gilbertella persicaria]|uniref:uncharacterized protein n=1 Tax=Gilbertella persicaria TaxID=101096 RepID=UPI0022200F15|nr:uncharacterized protein B0P05DRAFT_561973 [Gilbertella persicaria]KAI8052567.1 hypothetical protein B0P05DRAFT_561973 [Gilbertella persicaria]